jgi:hypothetical protein
MLNNTNSIVDVEVECSKAKWGLAGMCHNVVTWVW